jgi:hypothetical protein
MRLIGDDDPVHLPAIALMPRIVLWKIWASRPILHDQLAMGRLLQNPNGGKSERRAVRIYGIQELNPPVSACGNGASQLAD